MKYAFLIVAVLYFLTACTPADTDIKEEPLAKANCTYSRNELNPVGKPIKVVEDALFVTLAKQDSGTTEKSFMSEQVKGYLSCVRLDSVIGIYFVFKIYTANAYEEYGSIKKDNKISFKLRSGKTVEVPFAVSFSGNTNLSTDMTEYKTFSGISAEKVALLGSSELEGVKIIWTKKQEEYKVVNPAVFLSQLPCVQE